MRFRTVVWSGIWRTVLCMFDWECYDVVYECCIG